MLIKPRAPFHHFCQAASSLNRRRRPRLYLPPLILLTDSQRLPAVEDSLRRLPFASLIIFRDYAHEGREALGKEIKQLCRRYGHQFLVSGDAALAVRLNADGLHIPENKQNALKHWRLKKPEWVITAAAHSPLALRQAAAICADAALYSPVFPTHSHPGSVGMGMIRFAATVRVSTLPVYALGGVNSATVQRLKHSNAIGVAAIDAFA